MMVEARSAVAGSVALGLLQSWRLRVARTRLRQVTAAAREQAALQQVAGTVVAGDSVSQICNRAAAAAAEVFEADHGTVVCLRDGPDPVQDELPGVDLHRARFASGPLSLEERVSVKALLVAGGTRRIAQTPSSPLHAGRGERVAAPIAIRDELWGALVLTAAHSDQFAPGVEARLDRFAAFVASAVANAEIRERLMQEAATDVLTGLANRRVFQTRLAQEVARSRRHDRQLALVLCDVDHFKVVNDTRGHLAGDAVLAGVAGILRAAVRAGALVARIGGDEFAAIEPDAGRDEASSIADRVLEQVRQRPVAGVSVTLSVGIAEYVPGSTVDGLRQRADLALYAAKRAGRDTARCDDTVPDHTPPAAGGGSATPASGPVPTDGSRTDVPL